MPFFYSVTLLVTTLPWRNGAGLSALGYLHLVGDLAAFCFCVGLAAAIHWARMKMDVHLPATDQALLYAAKTFLALLGVSAGIDFGLLLWPGHETWIVVEVLLKFAMSLAAGLTFILVVHELPRLRTIHAGFYMRRLAEELRRGRSSKPPG